MNTGQEYTSDDPDDYIITRKRKLYKFAAFRAMDSCFDETGWLECRDQLFDPAKPLVVEVGAGSALFLTKLAETSPAMQFIAIDRKSDRLYAGARAAREQGLTNICYLWGDINKLGRLLAPSSIDELWITFPDPWPQESNIKHRLTNQKFIATYYKLLKPAGILNFKTDNRPLFDWSRAQFDSKLWRVERVSNDLHSDDNVPADARIMTTYEARYTRDGKPINYLRAIVRTH